jgi:hypothetical protein
MTLEAIELHRHITVAALAKVLVGANHAVVFPAGMALDAAIETVFSGAYALVHCFVALMHEQFHVVPAHEVGALDAFFALSSFDYRLGDAVGIDSGRKHAGKHGSCYQDRTKDEG